MNGKIAAVLLAATMLTTPAFAATVANSHNAPTTQTVTPDKGVKKHSIHARASHGHKVHHAKHVKQNQVKHTHKSSKTAGTKSHTKRVAAASAKAQPKN